MLQTDLEFFFDALDRLLHRWARGHVVAVRVNSYLIESIGFFARQRVKFVNNLKLFAKERQPPCPIIQVGRPNLKAIATHTETSPLECRIIAPILLRDEIRHHLTLVIHFAREQILRHGRIGFDRTDTVDTRNRRHDDHIVPLQQCPRRRVAHTVDLFVNLALFFDVGVRPRHIGFGLVVVVVGHEIFDGVVGEEPFELPIKLRRERLVRSEDNRRALRFLDHLGHGECLTRTRRPQQHLIAFALQNTRR